MPAPCQPFVARVRELGRVTACASCQMDPSTQHSEHSSWISAALQPPKATHRAGKAPEQFAENILELPGVQTTLSLVTRKCVFLLILTLWLLPPRFFLTLAPWSALAAVGRGASGHAVQCQGETDGLRTGIRRCRKGCGWRWLTRRARRRRQQQNQLPRSSANCCTDGNPAQHSQNRTTSAK